tara:strand:- start:1556 stop:1708 length:153 start_codon:yes stop_codon:yes gene_type:complete
MENEIQGENEDYLMDFVGVYGEATIIKYLSESLINKERVIREHHADLGGF